MKPSQLVPLSTLCTPARVMIDAGDPRALALRYIGLEHVESQTGRIAATSNNEPAEVASATFTFDQRHVLYGKLRPYLNKVALPDFPGRCTTEIVPLQPTALVSREYLWSLLRSPPVVSAAVRSSVGSRMPRAELEAVLRLEVAVHDPAQQTRLVEAIRWQEAAAEQARVSAMAQIEDAAQLVPTLLRGQFGDEPQVRAASGPAMHDGWVWQPLPRPPRIRPHPQPPPP